MAKRPKPAPLPNPRTPQQQFGRLDEQVTRGIVELDKTNPDLAAKMQKDYVDRTVKWLDYFTYIVGPDAEMAERITEAKQAMQATLNRRR